MLCAANLRYLEFISAIDTPTAGIDALRKISASVHEGEYSFLDSNCSMPKTRLSWRRWFEESIVSAASPKRPCVSAFPGSVAKFERDPVMDR
jgi:hypothetical protein